MEKLKTYWHNNKLNLSVHLIGQLFFLFYFLLAFIFYKERTIFIDAADFSFELIQNKSFVFPFGRWGSFFTQIIPLLAIKAGCSLSIFLKTYSLSIALFYYLIYLIIVFVFKNNKLTIVYLLTLCLSYRNTFYFSISELSQGLALCVLVYGLIKDLVKENTKHKLIKTIATVIIITALYYFHQLLLFAILFAILTIIIANKAYKNKYLISILIFSITWFGIKIFLLSSSGYEGQKIPGISVFKEQFPNLLNLPSFIYFVRFARIEMWLPIVFVVVSLIILLLRKKLLLSIFFIGYLVAYLILIVITYYQGEAPNMYEQYYILFGFFIALIIDSTKVEDINFKYILFLIIPLILFSTNRMFLAHKMPSKRILYLEQLAKKGATYENRKFIIHPNDFPWDYAWVTWALPMETILISSINNNDNTVTFFVPAHSWEVELYLENQRLHAPEWLRYPVCVNLLDTNFFNLPKESSYSILNHRKKEEFNY